MWTAPRELLGRRETRIARYLIRLNEVKERTLKALGDKEAYRFLGYLEKGGLSATLRRQIGVDIGGACGQLRASYLERV